MIAIAKSDYETNLSLTTLGILKYDVVILYEPDVLDMLTSLDSKKACGIDNSSTKLLKNCALPLL